MDLTMESWLRQRLPTSNLPREKTYAIPRKPLARSWAKIASYKNVM